MLARDLRALTSGRECVGPYLSPVAVAVAFRGKRHRPVAVAVAFPFGSILTVAVAVAVDEKLLL